ncbi:MAG: hypothetical protein Q7T76_06345 [Ferruginibacter sp.]|nr:hypothetical protein [Ferruginibacter sp.]
MATTDFQSDDVQFNREVENPVPSAIKTLTVLTFIGSAIGLMFILFLPAINRFLLGVLEKASNSTEDMSATQLAEMEKGKAAIEISQANMVPLMITGVIGIALCVWGAVWMRKLKKDGYWIYVAGELMPLVVSLILLGTAQFNGPFSVIIAVGIPVLFIILYTMQRKYLVR